MADVYRLTFPENALALIPLLDPAYRPPVDNPLITGDLRSGDLRTHDLNARNR